MERVLSNNWEERRPDGYDVVVVGSGYGGSITSARLAGSGLKPGLKICILERGREWPVGSFPDNLPGLIANTYNSVLNPLGLYEFDAHPDIAVIKGSGLGGTSLVNANVAIRPQAEIFQSWPGPISQAARLEGDQPGSLWRYYAAAERTLEANPHPDALKLLKIAALKKRQAQIPGEAAFEALPIVVNFRDGETEVYRSNGQRIVRRKCIDCGDCVTGCNVGAKNTLYMNYLPMAKKAGAQIFTQAEVDHLERAADGGWVVHVTHRDDNMVSSRAKIRAGTVILAAGSLGSTKILLQSERNGLRLGAGIGTRFSGNGDFFGLAYNADQRTDTVGFGNHRDDAFAKVSRPGPNIVGVVRYDRTKPLDQRFIIEDLSIPRAYRDAAAVSFRLLGGGDTDAGKEDEAAENKRKNRDLVRADPAGALNSTMLYLCIAHDDAGGTMYLDSLGKLRISWSGAGTQPVFQKMNDECLQHARALGATFIEHPIWRVSPWRTLVTAHPLGGCPMGEDGSDGAVDHLGRVFSGLGAEVHEGLYVADGSIVRTALGVNPFLTISALSERIAHHIILRKQGAEVEEEKSSVPVPDNAQELDPVSVIEAREDHLERIFSASETLPIEKILNSGQHGIDWTGMRIHNDRFWKGYFPAGSALNTFSSLFFAGFKKRFFMEGGALRGVTSDSDGRINARNVLEQITLTQKKGNLDKGSYILLRYPDPPWQLYYDVLKVINENLMIGRVYFGLFPHGLKIMTFPMVREYDFDHMTVDDFQLMFNDYGTVPNPDLISGVWQMRTIANSNHSRAVARLAFESKPGGRFEAKYQFMNLLEGISITRFTADQLEMFDFTPLHDEIRQISPDFMVGKWTSQNIKAFGPFHSGSTGLIHTEKTADGAKRYSFYYTLRRGSESQLEPPAFTDRILSEPVGAGIAFDEEMDGTFYPGVTVTKDTDIAGLTASGAKGVPCGFRLRIVVEDLDAFVAGPDHRARPQGMVRFGAFAGKQDVSYAVVPDAANTFFEYLRENPLTAEREMRYSLKFRADDGKDYLLWGLKFMQRDRAGNIVEILEDYTTLFTRVFEVDAAGQRGKEAGVALLKFRTFENLDSLASFMRFLLSFEVIGTGNLFKKVQARNKFNVFTLQFIFREYDPLAAG